jgi:hypothetical protein
MSRVLWAHARRVERLARSSRAAYGTPHELDLVAL